MQATKEDFAKGTKLEDSDGNEFTLKREYDEGAWEAKTARGETIIFQSEARFYQVV